MGRSDHTLGTKPPPLTRAGIEAMKARIGDKDKILQVFQWEHRIRYPWTDGRELPSGQNLENLGPAWYGAEEELWLENPLLAAEELLRFDRIRQRQLG